MAGTVIGFTDFSGLGIRQNLTIFGSTSLVNQKRCSEIYFGPRVNSMQVF